MIYSIKSSVNKLIYGIIVSLLILIVMNFYQLSESLIYESIFVFWVGILFADLDLIFGLVKGLVKFGAFVVFFILSATLFLSPISASIGTFILGLFGFSSLFFLSSALVAVAFFGICLLLSNLVLGIIPSKNTFHSYIVMAIVTIFIWIIYSGSLFDTGAFVLGYGLHLMIDGMQSRKNRYK